MIKYIPLFVCLFAFIVLLPDAAHAQRHADLAPIKEEAFEVMRQFFEYDRNVPFESQVVQRSEKPEYIREKIVFSGSRNTRTPGYLAWPAEGRGPYPCILLLHGLNSSKESWWEENSTMGDLTKKLLASGFSVLTLDAEYHGERLANNDFASAGSLLEKGLFVEFTDMIVQTAKEYRRAIDYLHSRPEIDTARIGVIGYSMGGMTTFHLSAVEPRVKTSVACVSPIVAAPYLPNAIHNFAPYIDRKPFLMLMAKNDERNYTEETARRLFDLIGSETKNIIFFDSGHMLPAEWTVEAIGWMEKYLN